METFSSLLLFFLLLSLSGFTYTQLPTCVGKCKPQCDSNEIIGSTTVCKENSNWFYCCERERDAPNKTPFINDIPENPYLRKDLY